MIVSDSILKSRAITLPTKVRLVKAMVFPVVMDGCESWTIKKADETSARTWCSGRTWRERVEWEVGGGIGMGNTCESMADSCQCMTKSTTIKKNF